MTTSISNSLNRLNPQSNLGRDFQPPTLSPGEYVAQINSFIQEGIQKGYSADYITTQIFDLTQYNLPAAVQLGFPVDAPAIKTQIVLPHMPTQEGPVMRALPNGGVMWADKNDQVVPWQDATQRSAQVVEAFAKEAAKDYVVGASLLVAGPMINTAKAIALRVAPVIQSAMYSVMGAAGSPQGQKFLEKSVDCASAFVDQTPPPTSISGAICYGINWLNEKHDKK